MWNNVESSIWMRKTVYVFHCLLSDAFLSKSYQIVLDRAVDTPGHGKYVVDGFNTVEKRYLATCLRMRSTPEKYKIDSKNMHVDAVIDKGDVSFAKECKRLLYLSDEIGTKGDKKHAK